MQIKGLLTARLGFGVLDQLCLLVQVGLFVVSLHVAAMKNH